MPAATCAVPGLQIERKRKKALPLSRPILTRLVVLGMLGVFFWQVSRCSMSQLRLGHTIDL